MNGIWLGKSPAETTGENYESSRTQPPHFLVQKLDVFFSQPKEPINKHHHGTHEYGHSKSISNKKG